MGIPGCGLCLSGLDIIPGFTGFVHRPNFYEKDLKKRANYVNSRDLCFPGHSFYEELL